MNKMKFDEVVIQILKEDSRYSPDAYQFVREAMDFTTNMFFKSSQKTLHHVTAGQLLEGIKKFTVKEYGPMSMTVLNSYGIHKCEDFGHIVFNLVNKGVFGKKENDSIHDFDGGFEFKTAFIKPFMPEPAENRSESKTRAKTQRRQG